MHSLEKDKRLGLSLSVIRVAESFISLACVGEKYRSAASRRAREKSVTLLGKCKVCLEGVEECLKLGQERSGSARACRPQGPETPGVCYVLRAAVSAGEVLILLITVCMRSLLQAAQVLMKSVHSSSIALIMTLVTAYE